LYILCDIDVPWTADGIRDRPANREEMLELFRSALEHPGARYEIVTGDLDTRLEAALGAVRAMR
jgi:nicotinamide riboside kinase